MIAMSNVESTSNRVVAGVSFSLDEKWHLSNIWSDGLYIYGETKEEINWQENPFWLDYLMFCVCATNNTVPRGIPLN